MKADLSRDTFDRSRHFASVRLQQGRVVTDADWNEQADIGRYRVERQARDSIGPCGAPLDAAGYGLVAETNALGALTLDPDTVWVLAEDGALLASDNDGADWMLADLGTANHLRAAAAIGNTGWIVGDAGVVRRTSDAGASWTALDAGTAQTLRGVAAVDASRAWAVGDGGIVVFTTDAGTSWTLVQTEAAALFAVAFADVSRGLAVGLGGAILSTGDGGQTWSAGVSQTTAHLFALSRVGTTLAWAAGSGGTVLRSADGGATWAPSVTPTDAMLLAIAFRDADEGWAVGENGTVLHSEDGGVTWVEQDVGVERTLRALSVVAGEPAWAVGDGGAAVRLGVGSPASAALTLPAVNLSIAPGRTYVNGILCELEERCSWAHQADGGAGERLPPGVHLLYLDVWQRHVSALADPRIREVALGGPDTATRARTVAQVRALALPAASPSAWSCAAGIAEWDSLVGAPRPRLAARAEPQLAATNICEIAATAGYRRLENQLYRVEVHDGGENPTFKWSRENGSVAYAVLSVAVDSVAQQTTVRVAARGRDANLDMALHDRVELTDDSTDLIARAGTLLEYIADGDDELELVLAGVPSGDVGRVPSRHPVLRRWDHPGTIAGGHAQPVAEDVWVELEDGVQVRFDPGGVYRSGDHWLIPARTITGDVEWPRDAYGEPLAREPNGIADAYCRLALVEVDAEGVVSVLGDCRELFPPLTGLAQLHYVSGDGQDAAPGATLPQPLALRVSRGTAPIAAAPIRFEVESGGGLLGEPPGSASPAFETVTDADGLAECVWTLGPDAGAPGRFQRVRASLLDASGDPLQGQVVVYCATASLLLQYVSGDGQEADPVSALAHPLQARIVNGGAGVPDVRLVARVEQGGGTLVGPATVTTGADGYAAFDWRLGPGGPQRVAVRLLDASGAELQRLEYTAAVTRATGGGGPSCEITIGPGGQFERLDRGLIEQLLEETGGFVCLWFLPGRHEIDELQVDGHRESRLSLHGCGPTALVRVHGPIRFSGFAALEVRDLQIELASERGMLLAQNGEISLSGLSLQREVRAGNEPCLHVMSAAHLRMKGCVIGLGEPAAAVFEEIEGPCHMDDNRFEGMVSFYGLPRDDLARECLDVLGDGQDFTLVPGRGRLYFSNNEMELLTIGGAIADEVLDRRVRGVLQSAVLAGNSFRQQQNVFVSGLLSFADNGFLAMADNRNPYGVMIATRAAAAGNVAVVVGDEAMLHFLTPRNGGFSGAANQVFTQPMS
jgi:photosystem II stability/assembly factor-like uncharacterized protein